MQRYRAGHENTWIRSYSVRWLSWRLARTGHHFECSERMPQLPLMPMKQTGQRYSEYSTKYGAAWRIDAFDVPTKTVRQRTAVTPLAAVEFRTAQINRSSKSIYTYIPYDNAFQLTTVLLRPVRCDSVPHSSSRDVCIWWKVVHQCECKLNFFTRRPSSYGAVTWWNVRLIRTLDSLAWVQYSLVAFCVQLATIGQSVSPGRGENATKTSVARRASVR